MLLKLCCSVFESKPLNYSVTGWMYGSLHGRAGMFPQDYIVPLAGHELQRIHSTSRHVSNFTLLIIFFFKSETPLSLDLGGIQTDSLLIFGQTPKPSCIEVQSEDSCLPKVLI